jgi:hypothetical protein
VIVRDGVVVGGWRSSRRSGRIEVSLDLQEPELREAVEEELGDIARFESAQVVSA